VQINDSLASRLIASQFPKWKDLSIRPFENNGWDNRSFRLGEDMVVRMPSAAEYPAQVEKEHTWLPRLAPSHPKRQYRLEQGRSKYYPSPQEDPTFSHTLPCIRKK